SPSSKRRSGRCDSMSFRTCYKRHIIRKKSLWSTSGRERLAGEADLGAVEVKAIDPAGGQRGAVADGGAQLLEADAEGAEPLVVGEVGVGDGHHDRVVLGEREPPARLAPARR